MLLKAIHALARQFDLPDTAELAPSAERRWRGLHVGNLGLLVPHDSGGELLEDARVHALPHAAAWCRGLINLRGRLIPAFDLHECLGLTRLRAARQWWLVLGRGEESLAFPLDALPVSLVARSTSQVQAAVIPERLRAFVGSGYHIDGNLWLEFRHLEFFRALTARAAA